MPAHMVRPAQSERTNVRLTQLSRGKGRRNEGQRCKLTLMNIRDILTIMRRYAPNDAFQDRVLDLLVHEGTNWLRDWYPTMAELDSQIPGVGLHWLHGNYYPHAHHKGYGDWDTVIRALRYVPMHLCSTHPAAFSRDIAECSIKSVEECLHKLGAASGVRTLGKPMGRLCSLLQHRTGVQLAHDIKQLNLWLIMAKHDSSTPALRRLQQHRFSLDEAVVLYYASRLLGSAALATCPGLLESYVDCATRAFADGQGLLTIYARPPDSPSPWSFIHPHLPDPADTW